MKYFIKNLLLKVSRIIYLLIPKELKDNYFKKKGALLEKLREEQVDEVWQLFSEDLKTSFRFQDTKSIRLFAINLALKNDPNFKDDLFYLEFGVWVGNSTNFFSKLVKKYYAFDSFKGLPEDWPGNFPEKTFDMNGKLPKLNDNVIPIVGYVEDTLENFLKEYNPKINFVHFDMDIYSATKYTLEKIKPYLNKNCVIIFDQLYNYINWKQGEYKALIEILSKYEFEYKAFNIYGTEVVIQIK